MHSEKRMVKVAGILLLIQMTTAILSYSVILDPILYGSKDFLKEVASNSTEVRIAAILDFITTISYFGIAVILFPILKHHSERIALWFVGIRLSEFVTLTISGILLLTLLSISQDYVNANMQTSDLQSLGRHIVDARIHTQNLNLLAYCFGTSLFYYLLFTSRLVPRFISIWGLTGVVGLFTEILASIFGYSMGSVSYFLMLPMGLNEIFLGIWLIVKGFNQTQMATY
jgi:hypothetical protein